MADVHPEFRKCPLCAEEIKWEAVKCKHCGEDLTKFYEKEKQAKKKQIANEKQAAIKKRDSKILVGGAIAFVLMLVLIISPVFGVVLIVICGLIYVSHKFPNGRRKLVAFSAKGGKHASKRMYVFAMQHKIPTAVTLLILILIGGVYVTFASTAPTVVFADNHSYSGSTISVSGKVTARCHCAVAATLNDNPLFLQSDGTFHLTLPADPKENHDDVQVVAKALSFLPIIGTSITHVTSTYNRQPTLINSVNNPATWKSSRLNLALHGSPLASVSIKEFPDAKTSLDANGNGNITVPFNSAYNVQTNSYTILALASGYAQGSNTVRVNNQNYDSARVAKEADAKKFAEMAQQAKNQMETYTGDGNVQVAIYSNIEEKNCVGYSCVNNPSLAKYILIDVTVRDAGNDAIYVNPNYVTIQDTSGGTYTPDTSTYGLGNYLNSVALQPGANTQGYLSFIVPRSEKVFTLFYASSDGSVSKPFIIQ